jgi:hypothetical protein
MTALRQTFPWWDVVSVGAQWGPREETSEVCGVRLKRMLEMLGPLHVGFGQLCWTGGPIRPLYPPPTNADELAPLFKQQRVYDSFRRRRLLDGFTLPASAQLENSRFISLYVAAGHHMDYPEQALNPNSVSISTVVKDVRGVDRPILEALKPTLQAVAEAWDPNCAGVFSYNYATLTHDPARRGPFSGGSWMLYLANDLARRVDAPPSAIVEHTSAGGMLLLATEAIFNHSDPPQRAAAEAMHAAVTAVGL